VAFETDGVERKPFAVINGFEVVDADVKEKVTTPAAKAAKTEPKTPASAERAAVPLAALNPYRTPWTVKVKLTNKGNVREYKSARGPGKVCSVDFVDEEGTAIGATLWREAIEKYDSVLEVGKVYYVSKGSLKPADKRYSTSGNDYEMNLDGKCEIDVCNDIDQSSAQKMQRAYAFVPINKLASKIGARGNVDVVAVVKEVSELSSIRRKSDNTELNKREVVLVDDSLERARRRSRRTVGVHDQPGGGYSFCSRR
jgi:replication factor A1